MLENLLELSCLPSLHLLADWDYLCLMKLVVSILQLNILKNIKILYQSTSEFEANQPPLERTGWARAETRQLASTNASIIKILRTSLNGRTQLVRPPNEHEPDLQDSWSKIHCARSGSQQFNMPKERSTLRSSKSVVNNDDELPRTLFSCEYDR